MEPSYTPQQPYQRRRRSERYQQETQADPAAAQAAAEAATPAEAAPSAEAAPQPQRQPLHAVVSSDEAQARAAHREPIIVARPSTAQINAQPEPGRRDPRPAVRPVDGRQPIIVAGSDKPRTAQQPPLPRQSTHYVPPRQPTVSQLPQPQSAPRTSTVQRVQPVQRVQAAQPAGGIERSGSGDHMLQSAAPRQASKPIPRKAPVPRWIIGACMVVFLLGLGCFTGRSLMDAYLYKQQTAREEAFQRVVEAHPLQYLDLIQRYSMEYNLQPAFVASIILNESSYNTHAESKVGARGLMQLMPDTAKWIAHKLGLDSSYNDEQLWTAETNIRFGCWYLNYLSKQFGGDAVTVASAYHTGQGEVSSWLNNRTYAPDGRALSLSGMPEGPTKVYAGRVTRDYGIYDALYFKSFNH